MVTVILAYNDSGNCPTAFCEFLCLAGLGAPLTLKLVLHAFPQHSDVRSTGKRFRLILDSCWPQILPQ
jgi:hypothetical protein